MQVELGEHISIMGPSGSGKTTLLNLVSGLDTPDEGEVVIDGMNISSLSEAARIAFRHRYIGMVYQDFCLLPGLSSLENVLLVADERSKEIEARALELLDELGVANRKHAMAAQLSGGEKQRVAIARALLNFPKLILADEPTAQLDRAHAQQFLNIMSKVRQKHNLTLITVTHDPAVAKECDRVINVEEL